MSKIWSLLPLLVIASAPAYAQNAPSLVTGRVEVRGGYDEVRTKLELFNETSTRRFSVSDVVIGAEAGVDVRPTENLLFGAYVGLDGSEADDCRENVFGPTIGDEACTNAGTNFTAGGRVGLSISDGGLVYVKGGYSRGKFEGRYTNGSGTVVFEDKDTSGGYHVGAGVELAFSRNVYVKAEYMHHRYHEVFKDTVAEPNNVDPSRHQILIGAGFRFGTGM